MYLVRTCWKTLIACLFDKNHSISHTSATNVSVAQKDENLEAQLLRIFQQHLLPFDFYISFLFDLDLWLLLL